MSLRNDRSNLKPKIVCPVDFIKDGLVWSPCCPRDSQECSLPPQFKSINFLALSLLYSQLLQLYMTTVMEWEMTTYSSILASEVPWTEEPGWLQSIRSQRTGHDWANTHTHTHLWNHHYDLYPYSLKNPPTPKQSLNTMQVFYIYSFIACELVYTQYIVITWLYEIIYFLMY